MWCFLYFKITSCTCPSPQIEYLQSIYSYTPPAAAQVVSSVPCVLSRIQPSLSVTLEVVRGHVSNVAFEVVVFSSSSHTAYMFGIVWAEEQH